MKPKFYDIQSVSVPLDEEDAQLMALFPACRESALNDMYLVRRGEETFLLRKEDVARLRKVLAAVFNLAIWCIGLFGLVMSVICWTHKLPHPGVWLLLFELCFMRYLIKVPSEVRGT